MGVGVDYIKDGEVLFLDEIEIGLNLVRGIDDSPYFRCIA
jgi:hypothetical protein